MSNLTDKDPLFDLLYKKSFRQSETPIYKLTSGQMSRFYIDCKNVSLDAEGAFLIGEAIFNKIESFPVDGVGGMTLGADPIATAVSLISFIKKKPIRKEPKQHGSGRQVEGTLPSGAKLVVVEDVVTTAGSTLRTIHVLRAEGYHVLKVVALIDRLEGGGEKIEAYGIPFEPLYTINDFINGA
jgi:orotate phosphoribosyltransferase